MKRQLRIAVSLNRLNQMELGFTETAGAARRCEYAVPATTLLDGILTIALHYRDCEDAGNVFDELKNLSGRGTDVHIPHLRRKSRRILLNLRTASLSLAWGASSSRLRPSLQIFRNSDPSRPGE
ncbi:MAG: hypothetical protein OEW15_06205 [Nitrospirota bacterium]|nr:hypothetical protein [Nitrospirota bacterium]